MLENNWLCVVLAIIKVLLLVTKPCYHISCIVSIFIIKPDIPIMGTNKVGMLGPTAM